MLRLPVGWRLFKSEHIPSYPVQKFKLVTKDETTRNEFYLKPSEFKRSSGREGQSPTLPSAASADPASRCDGSSLDQPPESDLLP